MSLFKNKKKRLFEIQFLLNFLIETDKTIEILNLKQLKFSFLKNICEIYSDENQLFK